MMNSISLRIQIIKQPLKSLLGADRQMLQLLSSKQLTMMPKSDETLTGTITIANNSKGCYIPYKIKSTNPGLFSVEPNRGLLSQKQTETIQISTIDAVNNVLAKQLSQKHKFLIEYVILDREPRSVEEAVGKIYGPAAQNFRVYINTDAIRSSRNRSPNHRDSEIGSSISNVDSFHSAHNKAKKSSAANGRGFFKSNLVNNAQQRVHHHPDSLDQLKNQVDYLEQERSSLLVGSGKKKPKSSGIVKKLIIMIIGVIAGNFGSKAIGFTDPNHSFFDSPNQEGSGGFFSSESEEEEEHGWF